MPAFQTRRWLFPQPLSEHLQWKQCVDKHFVYPYSAPHHRTSVSFLYSIEIFREAQGEQVFGGVRAGVDLDEGLGVDGGGGGALDGVLGVWVWG